MEKKVAALLFGGASSEFEVSCMSVYSVANNIDREKFDVLMLGIEKSGEWFLYDGELSKVRDASWVSDSEHKTKAFISPDSKIHGIVALRGGKAEEIRVDAVFPVLHGRNGEDGTVQGLLEIAKIPCVGCGVLASAVCMDKDCCHAMLKNAGVPQVKWLTFFEHDNLEHAEADVTEKLGYPVFVKPANAGSSVGITKVKRPEDLAEAFALAFMHDKKIIVEEAVKDPIEVECSVLGNGELFVGGPGEIVPADEFYTYDAKYYNAESKLYIPARLPEAVAEEIRETAKKAYKVLGCAGLARVDFLVEGATGKVFLNEPNTLPGFTDISMYPKLLMASGMTYSEIISRLFELAFENC